MPPAYDNSQVLARRFPLLMAKLSAPRVGDEAPLIVEKPLAVMWAQSQIKAPRPDALYIVGGLGAHVEAILPRMDASASLVIYEASLGRLKSSLKNQNYSAILSDPRVFLMAGQITPNDYELFHQLPVTRIREVLPLRFSPVWQKDEKAYAEFFADAARQFEIVRRLHLTTFNDGLMWQASTVKNLRDHLGVPDVGALAGKFGDLTAVLVAAGPSLDEAESFLKKVASRALIVAVNSSYRKLKKIGIEPHLVLAADPRDDTWKGFEGQTIAGTYLVAPFIVNTNVIQLFKGRAFSWSGENSALVTALRTRVGLPKGTLILEKGTVSLSVADLASLMGVHRLILVGQDMALGAGGLTHSVDSFYEGYKVKDLKYREEGDPGAFARRVPGNSGKEVTTLDNLYIYLKAFEQWIQTHPEVEVVNTAFHGAKIAGAPYMDYEAALAKATMPSRDITERLNEIFKNAPERKIAPEAWKSALKPTQKFAQRLYHQALSAAVALEILPERLHQAAYKDHPQIKEILAAESAINELIDKNPEDYRILLDGRLKKSLLDFQLSTRLLETASPFASSLTKNKEFFWALVEGIEPSLALFEEAFPKEGGGLDPSPAPPAGDAKR